MIVVAAITLVSLAPAPRKFGPPESPKQVPPSPWEPFCEIRSQLFVTELSVPTATWRTLSNGAGLNPVCQLARRQLADRRGGAAEGLHSIGRLVRLL